MKDQTGRQMTSGHQCKSRSLTLLFIFLESTCEEVRNWGSHSTCSHGSYYCLQYVTITLSEVVGHKDLLVYVV